MVIHPRNLLMVKIKYLLKKGINNKIISVDIDTGCVYGGKLTAFGISEDNKYIIYQV